MGIGVVKWATLRGVGMSPLREGDF